MLTCIPEKAFETGVLNREYHERLLADVDDIIQTAGIPPSFLWTRVAEYCQDEDVEWLKRIRKNDDHGLAFVSSLGKSKKPVTDRMMAITGACLRNYIDARVMSLQDVLAKLKDDTMPSPTVLLIPNFCLNSNEGGKIAQWQISALLGLLYTRMSKNLKTVVYIGSLNAVEKEYGESFRQHIETHFTLA